MHSLGSFFHHFSKSYNFCRQEFSSLYLICTQKMWTTLKGKKLLLEGPHSFFKEQLPVITAPNTLILRVTSLKGSLFPLNYTQTVKVQTSLYISEISISLCAHTKLKWTGYNNYCLFFNHFLHLNPSLAKHNMHRLVCLCWGFTAQSTQWGHVEHGQFTLPHFYWADLVL